MDKTTFITPWGTFCYKVMPFGLKNVGATYQMAMVTLFHDMIHKEIEVYILGQQDETGRKEHAIYYLRKKFTDCESRYSLLEKTCYPLVWDARLLRQYMVCHTTLLISRMDPIKYIFEKPALIGRIAKWQMLLTEYDIQYVTQKAIKESVLADYLVHQPILDYQPMRFDFPDEDVMLIRDCETPRTDEGLEPGPRWKLIFDGASNAEGHGIGATITSHTGYHIPFVIP